LPYPLEGEAAESILTPLYMLNLTLFRESHLVFKHLNRELIEIDDVVVGIVEHTPYISLTNCTLIFIINKSRKLYSPMVKYSWSSIKNILFGYFNRQYPFINIRFLVWFKAIPNSLPFVPYPLEGEVVERIFTPLYMLNLSLFRESHNILILLNGELIELDVVVGIVP